MVELSTCCIELVRETMILRLRIHVTNNTNPGYRLSLVDTLRNAGSYRQPLEQEGNPMT